MLKTILSNIQLTPPATFVLDGMTVQHVGEMIYGDAEYGGVPVELRAQCQRTYVRCLEDFAFALLFGRKIALSGKLPHVGKDTPGKRLLDALPKVRFHNMSLALGNPYTMLDEPYRDFIGEDLTVFEKAYNEEPSVWEDWMVREASSNFGADESLFKNFDAIDRVRYTFDKRDDNDRPLPYLENAALQGLVSDKLVKPLASVVRGVIKDPSPDKTFSPGAIEEFVRRNCLNLMAIYWLYEFRANEMRGIRLPHVTRAIVRSVHLSTNVAWFGDESQDNENSDTSLEEARMLFLRFKKYLVIHALGSVLAKTGVENRHDLIGALIELRKNRKISLIRRSIINLDLTTLDMKQSITDTDGRVHFIAPNSRKVRQFVNDLQKLRDDIEAASIADQNIEHVNITTRIVQRITNPFLSVLRPFSSITNEEYYKRLDKMFPELDILEQHHQPKILPLPKPMENETESLDVFISYSHEGKEHEDKALALADRLKGHGLVTEIDQYHPSPPEGWPQWMDKQIRKAKLVIMICTPTYYERVVHEQKPGTGLGVTWEAQLIYQHLYDAGGVSNKFVPVLFAGGVTANIPEAVRGKTYFRSDTREGYESLYRLLTDQHVTPPPPLGKKLILPPTDRPQTL